MKNLRHILVITLLYVACNTNAAETECPIGTEIKLAGGITKTLTHETDRMSFDAIAATSPVIQKLSAQNPKVIDLSMLTNAQYLSLENLSSVLNQPGALRQELIKAYAYPEVLTRITQAAIDLQLEVLKETSLSLLAKQLGGEREFRITEKMTEGGNLFDQFLEFMTWFSTAKYSQEIKSRIKNEVAPLYDRAVRSISARIFSFSDNQNVHALAMKKNGQQDLIAGNVNGSLAIWDFKSGNKLRETSSKGISYSSLAIGDNQRLLVGASGLDLYLLNPNDLSSLGKKQAASIIKAIAVHPQSSDLVAAQFGDVTYFDLSKDQKNDLLTNAATIFEGVAFSSSGKLFAVVGNNKILYVFDTAEKKKAQFNLSKKAFSVAFNPRNDNEIIVGNETGFSLINISSKTNKIYDKMNGPVTSVAFSSDGRRFAAASSNAIVVGQLNSTIDIKHTLEIDGTHAILFSPDDRTIIAGTEDGIRVIDLFAYENNHLDIDAMIYLAKLEQIVRGARGIEKQFKIDLPSDIREKLRTTLPSFLGSYLDNPALFIPLKSKEEKKAASLAQEISEFTKIETPMVRQEEASKQKSMWEYVKERVGY